MADEKDSKWQCYIIPDLATWTGAAASDHTPIEFYDTYEQAVARFQELRSESYNSEDLSAARLTFGVQRDDPPSAADLLQVRQGKNYLVDDYTRMDAVNQSPEVMGILKQMRKDLGFDRVRVYERDAYGGSTGPKDIPVRKIPTVWSKGYGISVTAKPANKRTAMARRATRPTFWTASSTNWCVRSSQR